MRKGKKLEIILNEIEKVRMPESIIKSPDYVLDKDTNTRREVDIGIRHQTEQGEIFIAIECRDRKNIEDIIWIEQLIQKKKSISADILVAVTSSKYTKSAEVKAYKNGILLRALKKFSGKDIEILLEATYIEINSIGAEIVLSSFDLLVTNINTLEEYDRNFENCFYIIGNLREKINFKEFLSTLVSPNTLLSLKSKIQNNASSTKVKLTEILKDAFIFLPHRSIPIVNLRKENILKARFDLIIKKYIEKYPITLFCKYKNYQTNDLLAELYEYENASKLILDSVKNEAKWIIDLSNLNKGDRVISDVIIKCKDPIVIKSLSLKFD